MAGTLQHQFTAIEVIFLYSLNVINYLHIFSNLKGLSHEIDFKNVDENGQILALLRAAAGF
jgi:hypothetical protein